MASSSSAEAQMKSEIARLTASINQHKLGSTQGQPPRYNSATPRANSYVSPNYKPPSNKYIRPGLNVAPAAPRPPTPQTHPAPAPSTTAAPPAQMKEVVLNGVAFESSGRSLVRKDLPKKPPSSSVPPKSATSAQGKHSRTPYVRKAGHLLPPGRVYKPKSTRGRNMTLTNSQRPYQSRRATAKRRYSDKPCPRFTTTGACNRGLTCMYQHDPSKIAICWNFLQGHCPNNAETCALSHDPTPERTPLCLHFLNNGRCTRERCPFPHVKVGAREGVCRDFAVLGYCAKGLDCERQHVRECPDFADKGECTTKGCKLPHVIRANRNRKATAKISTTWTSAATSSGAVLPDATATATASGSADDSSFSHVSAENAKLGDEYISLTFNESESSEEEGSEEEEEDESEGEEEENDSEEGEKNSGGEDRENLE